MKLRNVFLVCSVLCAIVAFKEPLWLGWMLGSLALFVLWGFTKMYNDDDVLKAEAEARGEYYTSAKDVTALYIIGWLFCGGFVTVCGIIVALSIMAFK